MSIVEVDGGNRESRRLEALAGYDVLDTPREKDFDDIAALASGICGTPIAVVNLVGANRQFFKAEVGLGVRETPFESSFCAKAILEDEFLMVPDATVDRRFNCNPLVTGDPHLRFYAGAILKTSDDLPIGTVCVLDYEPRELNEVQQQTLRVLARQVMVQLELRKALKEKAHEAEAQRRLSEMRLARAKSSETISEQLRLEEERSRSAQAAGRVGTFELDIQTNMLHVSDEFCRIFGVPIEKSYHAAAIEAVVVEDDRKLRSDAARRRDGTADLDVDYRIKRASDGKLRWVSRRARFVHNEKGEITRMVGAVFDTTDAKLNVEKTAALLRLGDQLRDADTVAEVVRASADILAKGLETARAGYCAVDQSSGAFVVEFDCTKPDAISIVGRNLAEDFPVTIDRLVAGNTLTVSNVPAMAWLGGDVDHYREIGARSLMKVPILKGKLLVGVLFVHDDRPRTWTKNEQDFAWGVADRTYAALAKIQAEEEQKILNQELSHRLKNTLAMVQAIAGQTLRDVTERDAVAAFSGRLQALSTAHDVLLQQSWSTAKIRDVIEKVMALHADASRLQIEGPDLSLGPKAGLSMSLLLHELATNALKYGALSNEAGKVSMRWSVEQEDDVPVFCLSWQESGGPPVSEPEKKGFGSRLIRMGLAGTGHADKRYDSTGLVALFKAPMTLIQETGT
ncbi:HWE histidine kinase domain-containing protein [Agrobacterium sp. ES01]|uniref:HWE histidine kinase domain-containing protein n=1 Tax=Agrobacterium sp. ES01 TaxID=3420714 RepID=UPI003D1134E7